MHRILPIASSIVLASCGSGESTPTATIALNDGTVAVANAPAEQMSLLNTSWEFSDDGRPIIISIDRQGAYIEEVQGGEHVDHGTYAQKDGKDCFTSAMEGDGISCWSAVPEVDIGESAAATSDDGETAVFKRVEYRPLKLPGQP